MIDLLELPLSSPTEYEALSYTWDDQKPTEEIICSEESLAVTKNVFQALQQLRSRKARRRVIWIDAICINQKDQAEKTSQVSMMGHIYARASRVNIWLSDSTEEMRAAFEYVRLSNGPKLSFDNVPDDGLKQLSSHPYWTRVWTVQEVALNRNCKIYLGRLKPLDISDFGVMLYEVEGYMNLRSEEISCIKVDYQRDLIDVLKEATVRILPCLEKLGDLLETVSHCPSVPEAPSWTLNITDGGLLWNATHYFGIWNATGSRGMLETSKINSPTTHRISCDMETLHVKGVIIDHVAILSDNFPHYELGNQVSWHKKIRNMLINWRIFTQKNLIIGFEESLVDIMFAAISAMDEMAENISQTLRFEKVSVYDEDENTLFTNSVYRTHNVDNPPNRDIQVAEKGKRKKARIEALREWIDDSDINYRLDHEEIISSSRSEGYSKPTIHSPALGGRNLCVTSKGVMALGKDLQLGDAIALLAGCDVPFALRPVLQSKGYTLGQPVLLPGVMLGQAWPKGQVKNLEEIDIV